MRKSSLFNIHNDSECPQCGAALVFKTGKWGLFRSCENYPQCSFVLDFRKNSEDQVVKVLEGHACPQCSAELTLRKGRYGMFICCCRYPECDFTETKEQTNTKLATCPQCQQGYLVEKFSLHGKIFYTCDNYPRCQFTMKTLPVNGECPYCHFQLLTQAKNSINYVCANKQCGKTITKEE